jgi:hypothetical protein
LQQKAGDPDADIQQTRMRSGQLADKFRPLLCPRQNQYRYVIVNLHALAYFADNLSGFSDDPSKYLKIFEWLNLEREGALQLALVIIVSSTLRSGLCRYS